ncbi:MAG: methylated-DNA--[protein]-cysteine S-methyltransferase [Nitrosomonadales bacterium]
MNYQAKLSAPFGIIGIRCNDNYLINIDFLSFDAMPQPAVDAFSALVCAQLRCYFANPSSPFSIPLKYRSTAHQQKVWDAMLAIPPGETRSYGELAVQLKSGAQAVGQACGANPVPIIIPCHRVVGRAGLGGFMKDTRDATLDIKRWLLAHEGVL